MNKIKIFFLLSALCLSFWFCGCQAAPQKESADLPQITIGCDTYPPYIYLDNNGSLAGLDVDIATQAFQKLGYDAKFTMIDWEKKDTLLNSGKIDCIWSCFSMAGREDLYQWAGPYMVSRQMVAVNETSSITQLSQLAGKTIAVKSTGKPEEIFLSGTDPRIPAVADVISTEERGIQFAALDCGYVDAVAAHETTILQYMQDYHVSFRILEEPLLTTGLGVAFAKSDDRDLAEKLDQTLTQMRKDGSMRRIIRHYLDDADRYLEVDSLEN